MADIDAYAKWLVDNQDKQGTEDYNTVAEAYKAMRGEAIPAQAQPQPVAQQRPSIFQKISSAINPPKENFPEFMGGGSPESAEGRIFSTPEGRSPRSGSSPRHPRHQQ